MDHPAAAQILSPQRTPEVESHLRDCASCARLARLRQPARALEDAGTAELGELPDVEQGLYRLEEELRDGRGGMGTTVRAFDRRLGRTVAIKRPLPGDAAMRARFEREARITARLEHPSIVTVYEAGRWEGGEPFYAMRLVQGASLSSLIDRCKSLGERLALLPNLVHVSDALAYAHAHGVIHRDVKPDNIMIGAYGQTVLIDWGVAYHTSGDDGDAPPVAGTPHYMAPEHATGGAPSEKLDVYGLGATLYHLIAGVPPFSGAGPKTALAARVASAPAPLLDVEPGAPLALASLVMRAMETDPASRIASARELAAELHRYLDDQLVASHHYSLGELVRRFIRRHRAVLAIAAIALIVVAVVTTQSIRRVVDERDEAARARAAAEASERTTALALEHARGVTASQLARDPVTRIDALLAAIQAVRPALAEHREPDPAALQGLADALLAGPLVVSIPEAGGTMLAAAFDDHGRLYTVSRDTRLRAWSLPDGAARGSIETGVEHPGALQLSADHRRAVVCGWSDKLAIVDLDSQRAHTIDAGEELDSCAFAGGDIVAAGARSAIRWSATGQEQARIPLAAAASALAVDGDEVLIGTTDGALVRWTATASRRIAAHRGSLEGITVVDHRLFTAGADGNVLAWSGDSFAVAYRSPGAHLMAIDPLGEPLWRAYLQGLTTELLQRASDGSMARLVALGPVVRVGDQLVTNVQKQLVIVRPHGEPVRMLGATPNGMISMLAGSDVLATTDHGGVLQLWDLAPLHPLGCDGEVTGIELASDATIARLCLGGRIALADHTVELGTEPIAATWFDGRLLVAGGDGQLRSIARDGAVSLVTTPPTHALAADRFAIAGGPDGSTILGPSIRALAIPATAVATAGPLAALGQLGGRIVVVDSTGAERGSRVLPDLAPQLGVHRLVFAGGLLLASVPGRTYVLDATTLATVRSFEGELVAPDVITSAAGVFRIEAGIATPLVGARHGAIVTAGASAGDRVATGDDNGTVIVWQRGRAALVVAPGLGAITALAFAGDHLLVGDARGASLDLPLLPRDAIAEACRRLARVGRPCP